MSCRLPVLPYELVVEILTRVGVKDLLRFRCVCKSWSLLFQDESFIRQHMSHGPRRILGICGFKAPLYHFTYESGKPDTIVEEVDLSIGDQRLLPKSFVIGTCHGLLCLDLLDGTFAIWNPSLRELRRIPTRHIYNWAEKGFGYDYSTQDYKIVLVQYVESSCSSKAHVLSLNSGGSRIIDFPFVMHHMREQGTLVGENIYWPVFDDKFKMPELILSFDLVSETFNYYPGRPNTYDQPHPRVLDVLRGSLCTVGIERGNVGLELVVWSAQHGKDKNNAGVIESWSKVLSISWVIVESSIGSRRRVESGWLVSATTCGDCFYSQYILEDK